MPVPGCAAQSRSGMIASAGGVTLPSGTGAGNVIATATDADGNTSEFSNAMAFVAVPLANGIFHDGFED